MPAPESRRLLVCCAALLTCATPGWAAPAADAWPSQPLKIMVGFAAGGANDIVARILAKELQQRLGQSVVVENRGGAGGLIASEVVAKAPKNGYTLLLGSIGSNTVAPVLAKKLSFDPRKDLEPITLVAESGNALLVNAALPYKTVQEMIEAARKAPGSINYASSGNGSTLHLAGALFAQQAGVNLVHVPYRGNGPAITDVSGGQVQAIFSGIPPAITSAKTGQTRILAVTTKQRVKNLPNVPTVAEAGLPGYAFTSWYGLFTTGGTDPAIVERLAQEVRKIMERPEVQAQFEAQGLDPETSDPKSFKQQIDRELTRWSRDVKTMGITAD
ncbi:MULTISPECIES: Bug family tripartite tricarboxylate transporter substrate binding protein [unclassified Delftia]|uniref:Bug family tripartite tricarboxylate transporter substrate binding protein n=1 Tax=unclassified Delftia TaxID=2613839 RepID=UPI0019020C4F|nr:MULTISPECIES: tripartite tricarboxylate transporter substrate binding protein [unclassified Delftia]MBK0111159.1 tripartite tricarboxylate transporter substrate binding protein [Delftia sp. S65]MBK0117072.1 tripartite tricarboxylate transporter substrate binding protein [Delftia sp. S67]MBK0128332.1 tripartite tricarboxylate transporter substrate binding protein [Delftia sp. S66]